MKVAGEDGPSSTRTINPMECTAMTTRGDEVPRADDGRVGQRMRRSILAFATAWRGQNRRSEPIAWGDRRFVLSYLAEIGRDAPADSIRVHEDGGPGEFRLTAHG